MDDVIQVLVSRMVTERENDIIHKYLTAMCHSLSMDGEIFHNVQLGNDEPPEPESESKDAPE